MDSTLETLLTPAQVATYLGVTCGTLAQWRWKGIGPRWVKLSRGRAGRVRYDHAAVIAWKSGCEV